MSRLWRPRRVVNGMPRQVPSAKNDERTSFLRLLRGTDPSMSRVPDSTKLFYVLTTACLIVLFVWGQSGEISSPIGSGKATDSGASWGSLNAWQQFASAHPTGVAAACAISVLLLCPSALVQALSGAVLGFGPGFLAAVIGTLAGQAVAFILGRYLARDALAQWLAHTYPQFGNIEVALFQQDGIKLVFLVRLSPFLPDSVMNYALALTSVSWQLFWASTLASTISYTLLYTYLGSASSDVLQVLQGNHGANSFVYTALVCVGAASLVALLVVLAVALKRAMGRASQQQRQQHQQQLERAEQEDAEQQRLHRLGWREQQRWWAQQRQQHDAELGQGHAAQKQEQGPESCGATMGLGHTLQRQHGGAESCGASWGQEEDGNLGLSHTQICPWDAPNSGARGVGLDVGQGLRRTMLQQQGHPWLPTRGSIQHQQQHQHQQQQQQETASSATYPVPAANACQHYRHSAAEGEPGFLTGPGSQQHARLPLAVCAQQGRGEAQGQGGKHGEKDQSSCENGLLSWSLQGRNVQGQGQDPICDHLKNQCHGQVIAQGEEEARGPGGSRIVTGSQSMRSLSVNDLHRMGAGMSLRALSAAG